MQKLLTEAFLLQTCFEHRGKMNKPYNDFWEISYLIRVSRTCGTADRGTGGT